MHNTPFGGANIVIIFAASSKSSLGRAGFRTSWPPTHGTSFRNYTGVTFSTHGPFLPWPCV